MSRNHRRLNARRWAVIRRNLLDAANWRCSQCGRYSNQVDHIVPLHKGGAPFDPANLQPLCGGRDGCHAKKTLQENRREPTPAEAAWRDLVAELLLT